MIHTAQNQQDTLLTRRSDVQPVQGFTQPCIVAVLYERRPGPIDPFGVKHQHIFNPFIRRVDETVDVNSEYGQSSSYLLVFRPRCFLRAKQPKPVASSPRAPCPGVNVRCSSKKDAAPIHHRDEAAA
jgi:hypothetical protein